MKKSEVNILIVEDDKSLRDALTEFIKRKGYRAIAVSRPEEAESLVKIKPVHALIVDVMLPGKNGVELVSGLKENLIDGVSIVFISGVYRDKGYAAEAIQKVSALDYVTKPFELEPFFKKIEGKLKEYLDAPKINLHSLLTQSFATDRMGRKALDHVEDMSGFDLPFVFCILMDTESSGHLNIVDSDQNIFGVTFSKGSIAKFDSEATILQTKKLLIQHGFVSESDFGDLKGKGMGPDLVKNLVDEGLISPHVPGVIKNETIINGLKRLINKNKIKINFVPDRHLQIEEDNIAITEFSRHLHDIIDQEIPLEWLKSFYSFWMGHKIIPGPRHADAKFYTNMPILKDVHGIVDVLKKELTIEDIIAQCPQFTESNIFKAIHFLMLRRVYVFDEVKIIKNIDEHVGRLKTMHEELKNKNHLEVFKYFGLGDNPKPADVIRIYKEFAKSHHPDTLPKSVNDEIKKINHDLFAQVTAAYEVLTDEKKKEAYLNELKQNEAERQIRSDDMVTLGAQALSRGRYSEALPILENAVNLFESERSLLHYWWAKFKVEGQMKATEIEQITKKLSQMSPGARKTAIWYFIGGLVKKFGGDLGGAGTEFLRAIKIDDKFMDARRELMLIKSKQPAKMTTDDILNGDLSSVIKNLFKKKKGA